MTKIQSEQVKFDRALKDWPQKQIDIEHEVEFCKDKQVNFLFTYDEINQYVASTEKHVFIDYQQNCDAEVPHLHQDDTKLHWFTINVDGSSYLKEPNDAILGQGIYEIPRETPAYKPYQQITIQTKVDKGGSRSELLLKN